MGKHDLTGNQLQWKLHRLGQARGFRYSLYVMSWLVVIFSIAGMVEV